MSSSAGAWPGARGASGTGGGRAASGAESGAARRSRASRLGPGRVACAVADWRLRYAPIIPIARLRLASHQSPASTRGRRWAWPCTARHGAPPGMTTPLGDGQGRPSSPRLEERAAAVGGRERPPFTSHTARPLAGFPVRPQHRSGQREACLDDPDSDEAGASNRALAMTRARRCRRVRCDGGRKNDPAIVPARPGMRAFAYPTRTPSDPTPKGFRWRSPGVHRRAPWPVYGSAKQPPTSRVVADIRIISATARRDAPAAPSR